MKSTLGSGVWAKKLAQLDANGEMTLSGPTTRTLTRLTESGNCTSAGKRTAWVRLRVNRVLVVMIGRCDAHSG